MKSITLYTGAVYQANIHFGFFDAHRVATNAQIKDYFEGLGFSSVTSTGSDRSRVVVGMWTGADGFEEKIEEPFESIVCTVPAP